MKILTTTGYVPSVYNVSTRYKSQMPLAENLGTNSNVLLDNYDTTFLKIFIFASSQYPTTIYLHKGNTCVFNNNIHNSFLIRISLKDMWLLRVITHM